MSAAMFKFEERAYQQGYRIVAGVDEAGRGPLAGPVVAAAVVLPRRFHHETLTDSKQLRASTREKLFEFLTTAPGIRHGVGICSTEEIDRLNILRATHRAMRDALAQLDPSPDHVLVDGRPVPGLPMAQTAIVGGDGKSFSIAAASVIAKVTRDRLMRELHQRFPEYNFARHKGYATAEHLELLRRHGPCPVHRRTFAPVRQAPVQGQLW